MVLLMGVLNVTPDSFSDGGRWADRDAAVAHGRQMVADGADVIDIGGESTRPGATPVPLAEELRRVVPVVEALAGELAGEAEVSVDTRTPAVAEAAIAAGATIVNDVSASLWPVALAGGAGWVAMHSPADPRVMQDHAHYADVVAEVRTFLVARAGEAAAAGLEPSRTWIDPGIGFAKTARHNLSLLRHLDELVATGWQVAVGTSRKAFLGAITAGPDGVARPPEDRLEATMATVAGAVTAGAAMVRVHDVAAVAQLLAVAGAAAGAPVRPPTVAA